MLPENQVDRRQNRLPSGNMFPQERPTSAPSQRPEEPSNGVNSGSGGRDGRDSRDSRDENRIATTESADSFIFEAAKNHPPKSSSMRTTYEGYPMHGLMPSGSKLTMNDHLRQRWREATSARNGHSHAAQTHANHGPSRTGDGGGRGGGSGGEGGGGGGGAGVDSSKELRMGRGAEAGGLYSSTESLRLARMLAGGGAESEVGIRLGVRKSRSRAIKAQFQGAFGMPGYYSGRGRAKKTIVVGQGVLMYPCYQWKKGYLVRPRRK